MHKKTQKSCVLPMCLCVFYACIVLVFHTLPSANFLLSNALKNIIYKKCWCIPLSIRLLKQSFWYCWGWEDGDKWKRKDRVIVTRHILCCLSVFLQDTCQASLLSWENILANCLILCRSLLALWWPSSMAATRTLPHGHPHEDECVA